MLPSHPLCDLIVNDIFAKQESRFIKILKEIWDDEYFQDTFDMLVSNLKLVPNSIHLNFFESNIFLSLKDLFLPILTFLNHFRNFKHFLFVNFSLISFKLFYIYLILLINPNITKSSLGFKFTFFVKFICLKEFLGN